VVNTQPNCILMSRSRKTAKLEYDEPKLDISSLIDICFLLLIYFLVTSTIQPKEHDLTMVIPTPNKPTAPIDIEPLSLEITKDGAVKEGLVQHESGAADYTNPRKLTNLERRLEEYSNAMVGTERPAIKLAVHGDAREQHVVDVLNAIAGAQISQIAIVDAH